MTDAGCLAFRPIRPTAADITVMSDRLVDQLLAHNEIGLRVCGWHPGRTTGPASGPTPSNPAIDDPAGPPRPGPRPSRPVSTP